MHRVSDFKQVTLDAAALESDRGRQPPSASTGIVELEGTCRPAVRPGEEVDCTSTIPVCSPFGDVPECLSH
jgi:hypothetical protein